MLTLRTEQMEALAKPSLMQFEERMLAHVQTHWPEALAQHGETATREIIAACITEARDHGLRSEYDVGRFIDLAFALAAPRFYDDDWAQGVLDDPDYPPRIKVNILWQEVRRRLDQA